MALIKVLCITIFCWFAFGSCDAQIAQVTSDVELSWIKKASDALYWSCAKDTMYSDSCLSMGRHSTWSFYSKVRATHSVPLAKIMSLADSVAISHGTPSGNYDLFFGWSPSEGSGYTLYSGSIFIKDKEVVRGIHVTFNDFELYLNKIDVSETPQLPEAALCGIRFTMIGTIRNHKLSTVRVVCHE